MPAHHEQGLPQLHISAPELHTVDGCVSSCVIVITQTITVLISNSPALRIFKVTKEESLTDTSSKLVCFLITCMLFHYLKQM